MAARLNLAFLFVVACAPVTCAMAQTKPGAPDALPAHLSRWPGLFVRVGEKIVDASAEDQAVAKGYPTWARKGALGGGMRLTLLTKKTRYAIGEEIRVLHVFEAPAAGIEVYAMGPKRVYGESIDGLPITEAPPTSTYPWLGIYDGGILKSPAVDYHYEISSYRFTEPGAHTISWQLGPLQANSISVVIGDGESAAGNKAPLFEYEEPDHRFYFFAPRSVRLVLRKGDGAKACQNALPDHGNMWTGRDVEGAFRAVEVQGTLSVQGAPHASEYAGKLIVGDKSIVWASACKKCRAESAPLKHLREVLHTVIENARLLCK